MAIWHLYKSTFQFSFRNRPPSLSNIVIWRQGESCSIESVEVKMSASRFQPVHFFEVRPKAAFIRLLKENTLCKLHDGLRVASGKLSFLQPNLS